MFTRIFGGPAGKAERSARAALLANLAAPSPGKPSHAVATAGVSVDFHVHPRVDGVTGQFLTAVSDGLQANKQRELVLTLRLGDRENPIPKMQEIISFVAIVRAWSLEGNLVTDGGFTQFGERGLFQRPHSGLIYADARPVSDLKLPTRALAAISVDADEVRTARDYGTYRVLMRLGVQLKLFPYPTWGALDRPSAVTPREGESRLAKLVRMRAPGVSFLVTDDSVTVSIPSDAKDLQKGLRALPSHAPFVLFTRPAPSANQILVWQPGQEGPRWIAPDDAEVAQKARLSGSCLVLIPGGKADQARPFEDGYGIQLSADSWAACSAALASQRPLSLPLADGKLLKLEWLQKAAGPRGALAP